MKILITSDWYKPVINGVVTSVANLVDGLTKMGHEVRVITLSGSIHSRVEDNIYYIGSLGVGLIYPNARVQLALKHRYVKEAINWKPDIVHSQCEFSTFFIARKVCEECDIPLLHTYHTVYEDYTHYFSPNVKVGKRMVAFFTRKVIAKTNGAIAPTDKVKDMLLKYRVEQPIFTVPSGLDLDKFSAPFSDDDKLSLKKKLGINPQSKVILYLGRLAQEKNIEELFDLASHLNETADTVLLLVGDGPYKDDLVKAAKACNITDKVIFAGMVNPGEVPNYYKLGDVFVSASQSETQGLTYIEAMACGIPVVCKNDKCLDAVINNGINGYVFEDTETFKKYTNDLLNNSTLAEYVGENAAKTIKAKFSKETFASSIVEIYEFLIVHDKFINEIERKSCVVNGS